MPSSSEYSIACEEIGARGDSPSALQKLRHSAEINREYMQEAGIQNGNRRVVSDENTLWEFLGFYGMNFALKSQ